MPKQQKRFVVVMVNGQAYECERPFGCPHIRACCNIVDGQVASVWVEAAPSEGMPMANPYLDSEDE